METKLGVLTFRPVTQDKIPHIFTRPNRVLLIKTPKQSESFHAKQIAEKLNKYLKVSTDILFQEYLSANDSYKTLTVKWRSSNKLEARLIEKAFEYQSEAFVSLGQRRAEILSVATLVKTVLEESFNTTTYVRSLQLEFVMDSRQNWRLLKVLSYKTGSEPYTSFDKPLEPPRRIITNSVRVAALQLKRRARRSLSRKREAVPEGSKCSLELTQLIDKVRTKTTSLKFTSGMLHNTFSFILARKLPFHLQTRPNSRRERSRIDLAVEQLNKLTTRRPKFS